MFSLIPLLTSNSWATPTTSYPDFNVQSLRLSVDATHTLFVNDSSISTDRFFYKSIYSYSSSPFKYTDLRQNQYEIVSALNQVDWIVGTTWNQFRLGILVPTYINATGYRSDQLTQIITNTLDSNPIVEPLGIGDLTLDAKVQIQSRGIQRPGVYALTRTSLPTSQSYLPLGDPNPTLDLELGIDTVRSGLLWMMNVGHRYRTPSTLGSLDINSGVYGRLGTAYTNTNNQSGLSMEVVTESIYSTRLPITDEIIASAWTLHNQHIVKMGLSLGMGSGLTTPAIRFLLSIQPTKHSKKIPNSQSLPSIQSKTVESTHLNPANGQIQIQTQDKEGNHIEATWWIEDTSISPFSTNEPQFIQPGEHQIIIYARGYRTVRQTVMVDSEELQRVTIPLTRTSVNLEDGILILSTSIAFDENSDAIRNTHTELLRDVAMTLQSTTHHLLISGHVDPVEFEKNPDLAQQRVDSVQRLLEEYGLDPNRIHSVVVHSEHPIASNHVENGRSLNRRVELTVLDETPSKESQ